MKICTITCHDVYNHGASLQAYALMTYLRSCGHEAEIIDYKPDYLSRHYRLFSIDNPRWGRSWALKLPYLAAKLPGRLLGLRRKRAFDRFTAERLRLTPRRYDSNEALRRDPPAADAYLCGSDQIWNALHPNGRDPAFYLDFAPRRSIRASYAASFATDTIPEDIQSFVREKTSALDGVGVRERSGVRLLHRLGIDGAVPVVDPVFLLDRRQWDALGSRRFDEDYLLVYDFDDSPLIRDIARRLSARTGWNIYTVNAGKLKYADRSFAYDGPETFVSLARQAKFVVSNSFHAAVFSILYGKPFAIVNRTEAINTRMRDLLMDLELTDRLVGADYDLEALTKPMDGTRTRRLLEERIEASKRYLSAVLSGESAGRGSARSRAEVDLDVAGQARGSGPARGDRGAGDLREEALVGGSRQDVRRASS
jgi:hypothetical protein